MEKKNIQKSEEVNNYGELFGVPLKVLIDELVQEAEDNLMSLKDIQETIALGKKLDTTQKAFLNNYIQY